jgi:uncharacterized membrane protein YeaQ/YmgE (transglycosylase-associated protein family)
MPLSDDVLLVVVLVGLLAGSAISNIGKGSGLGLPGDLATGLLGAFIGYWLLPEMHIHIGQWVVSVVIDAMVGAVVLLIVFRLVTSSRTWEHHANQVSRGFERVWRTRS